MIAAEPAPLATRWRGDDVESIHYGHLVIVDAEGHTVFSRGQPTAPVFARSALKPVQALPVWLIGADEAFGLPPESLAVALASHSGEPVHQAAVAALLSACELTPVDLQCGTHAPYHAATALALACRGEAPNVLHCNCSGKHAAMLAVCLQAGWDLQTYREVDHPLQKWILALLTELAAAPKGSLTHAIDGCGVPTWRVPLVGLARTFGRLATPAALRKSLPFAAEPIARLMNDHPRLIAGEGRFDTELLAAAPGRFVAKIGGEAVHAGGVVGTGLGWAIKIVDGHKRAIGPALARALAEVGITLPEGEALAAHTRPVVRNNHGEAVGRLTAGW